MAEVRFLIVLTVFVALFSDLTSKFQIRKRIFSKAHLQEDIDRLRCRRCLQIEYGLTESKRGWCFAHIRPIQQLALGRAFGLFAYSLSRTLFQLLKPLLFEKIYAC